MNGKFRGCLLGGAIGDSIGWKVEFLTYKEILRQGLKKISKLERNAEITDDTQLTLFTAEGLILACSSGTSALLDISYVVQKVYEAYRRWLYTQGYRVEIREEGWLCAVKQLHVQRAPGATCISALMSGRMGTIEEPINNSKGSGGIMRIAPVGLLFPKDLAFELGCKIAAITHGHPSGYYPAGTLAYIISALLEENDLSKVISEILSILQKHKGTEETIEAIEKAIKYSKRSGDDFSNITELGQGWTAEEALSIAVYCALKYQHNFKKAVLTAVIHDGDSDTTGAITGNILGVYHGVKCIPWSWRRVELTSIILRTSDYLEKLRKIFVADKPKLWYK
ncbi:ADP-ribosylation/Crystallin J1 [Caldicellulosiruptor acetigenus I77R1B]|uniref:ADP-ribosylation/Crystallin J1 n=2 Tax=Caldicellulosiruptor acetigenus TaxID=301953 RepID=E4S5B2_CALA7|nr:ADP-ribosylation/Crystallin J1 [Caldicellulosiruptor acetigenus I77R1B]